MNSAKFYKVSYEQFQTGMEREDVKDIYDAIKLPRRATKGSADRKSTRLNSSHRV